MSFLIARRIRVQSGVEGTSRLRCRHTMEPVGSIIPRGRTGWNRFSPRLLAACSNGTSHLRPLYPADAARAARSRPRAGESLSLHIISADRVPLPASADLFGICGRSAGAARPVGWRLDDAGKIVALSSLWNIGAGFRAARKTGTCTLVPAVALRKMARHKYGTRLTPRAQSALPREGWDAGMRQHAQASGWRAARRASVSGGACSYVHPARHAATGCNMRPSPREAGDRGAARRLAIISPIWPVPRAALWPPLFRDRARARTIGARD